MAEPATGSNFSLVCKHGPEGYYLVGGKCSTCNEIIFPKPAICPRCTSTHIAEIPLSRRGKLYTYTEVYQKPPDYGGTTPYIIGRILLPEGVFILSQLDANFADLKVNEEMRLSVKMIYRDECGNEVKGYMFSPVKDS